MVMKKGMFHKIVLLAASVFCTACTISPGMKMERPPATARAINAANQIRPTFIPIDAFLIQQMSVANPYVYHIGPQDVLDIYVWGHPEFNAPLSQVPVEQSIQNISNPVNPPATLSPMPAGYLVGPDGKIFYPLVGSVPVAGKTVEQIRVDLSRLLTRYIRRPQLNVRVAGFRSKKIYVMGEVVKPGLQPLTDAPLTITDAINLSGGLDPNTSDASHIFVIRGNYVYPEVYWLNAKSPKTLLLASNFRLEDRDVVYVSSTDTAKMARVINQILPAIQAIWYTAAITTLRP